MAIQARFSWRPTSRLVLIVCAALALFVQSYAGQTHFHQQPARATGQASAQTGQHHQPVNDDSDNCPLCHSFTSGQYVAPSLVVWFLPILAISIVNLSNGVSPHYDTVSHNWRGRGPPRI